MRAATSSLARALGARRLLSFAGAARIAAPTVSSAPAASSRASSSWTQQERQAAPATTPAERIREMLGFWTELGLPDRISQKLARLAERRGTAWGNPDDLRRRLDALHEVLPSVPMHHLLENASGLLMYDPQELRGKLEELGKLLPRVDLLKLLTISPDVLTRDMAKMSARIDALSALHRRDIPQLIAEHPQLLREDARTLRQRCAVLPRAYTAITLQKMSRERLASMLRYFSANRLLRLEYVSAVYPDVRAGISDFKLLRLSPKNFQKGFRLRRMNPKRLTAAKNQRALGPVRQMELPAGSNVFRAGEVQLAQWQRDLAIDKQEGTATKPAAAELLRRMLPPRARRDRPTRQVPE